ncbi:beta-lactamase family protein [Kordiimonas sp. SCSIO 12603]|uniref:serine hydrolase domain-containing protein n=1 Tax=Kordiimonas sp. SCSIO 12603 TaxID=2829596 RepID=UPI002106DA44|nr:serine hydrolase domain-containing protein [Kordiimonas sp. SCSIO 12603]UTW59134.1 beta-lactamase family protein [Kordiimonas sp. SCSIO 12603]
MKYFSKIAIFISLLFLSSNAAQSEGGFGPKTSEELRYFLDTWFEENLPKYATLGTSVSFVKNGEVYLSKGYGTLDIKRREGVQSNTIFRVASVSKIFVGIAAAQLIEQGIIDLDEDIRKYIGDTLIGKEEFSHITMRHLLGHTSGLDEQFYGDSTLDPNQYQELEEHLKTFLPPLVREPGQLYAYSNYGYALAAYVVEKTTGMPFSKYVKDHILTPLNMHNSSYTLENYIKEKLATGYDGDKLSLQERPYTYVHRYPSTSMMTSAEDMANLMIAVLNSGTYEDRKVYGNIATKLIQTPLYETTSQTSGYSAGFQLSDRWGHQIIWHDGTHFGFNAYIMLFPELNMGFFAASNHHDGNLLGDLRFDLLNKFFKPNSVKKPQKPYQTYTDHNLLKGTYINSRRALENLAKINNLFITPLKITSNADNTINVFGRNYAEIKPDIFARTDLASRRLKVNRDNNGDVISIAYDVNDSPAVFERQSLFQTASTHHIIFLGFILWFSTSFIYRLFINKKKQQSVPFFVTAPNAINLVFILSFIAFFASLDLLNLRTGNIPAIWIILSLPILAMAVSIISLWRLNTTIKISVLTIHQKVFWISCITVQLLFLLQLHFWNLLGFKMIS